MTAGSGNHKILLVEDSDADAELAREAFREAGVHAEIQIARDGVEALHHLRGNGAAPCRPDLILLDLKLGRIDGHEVLAEVKGDPELAHIPVVVLTTSVADPDIQTAYALHANSYLRKPVTFDEFVAMARTLDAYWFGLVRLPS